MDEAEKSHLYLYIFLRGNNHCTLINAQLNLKSQQPTKQKPTFLEIFPTAVAVISKMISQKVAN